MATLFSMETILLEIQKSLGLSSLTSKQKRNFQRLEMKLDNFIETYSSILDQVFNTLGMDMEAREAAVHAFEETMQFLKNLEPVLKTYGASEEQVLWLLLGYTVVPGVARKVAFWHLFEAMDEGMPGGWFWYLPTAEILQDSEAEYTMVLPVTRVIDWLLDLLAQPMDAVVEDLGDDRIKRLGAQDKIKRTLHNWKTGSLPTVSKIDEFFSEQAQLSFLGCFELPQGLTAAKRFVRARQFALNKGHTADSLRREIPLSAPGVLENILNDHVDEQTQSHFVDLLLVRYQQPTIKTVRLRLLIARMIQDGYTRLLKFLCPGISVFCADPKQNKITQLLALFARVYNFTIDASKVSDDAAEQDAYFENLQNPVERLGLMIAVNLSLKEIAVEVIAQRLSTIFYYYDGTEPLPDLLGIGEPMYKEVLLKDIKRIEYEQTCREQISELTAQLKKGGAPWKKLQKQPSFEVIMAQVDYEFSNPIMNRLNLNRAHELATTPRQYLQVALAKLSRYLDGSFNNKHEKRPKDAVRQVQILLSEAKANPDYDNWEAEILNYEARHHLSINQFDQAAKLFRAALKSCHIRNYASLRGRISKNLFATEVANQCFIPANHEIYYRNMLFFGMFET